MSDDLHCQAHKVFWSRYHSIKSQTPRWLYNYNIDQNFAYIIINNTLLSNKLKKCNIFTVYELDNSTPDNSAHSHS